MTSADQALRLVLENVTALGVERVPILDALGRVIAEEIRSPRDIPGFDNSAMDGYALRAADVARASASRPARLRMLGTVAAGAMPAARVEAGTAMRTMTGAPVAEGADAIVPVEQTRAEFVLQLEYLLRERRLRNVAALCCPGKRACVRDGAEVTKLVQFHRLCLSILSKLDIGTISRGEA